MFYAAPEKHGTITVKPKIIKNRTNTIKPANDAKPATLAQFQKEIEARQNEIASLNRRQYTDMLKGVQTGKLNAAVARQEVALKALKTQYANAMGLGERKRGNQLLPQSNRKSEDYNNTLQQPLRNSVRTAEDDKDFWDGFKRGLGLKEGEELGQESASGRPYSISSGPGAGRTPSHEARLNGEEEEQTQQSGGDGQFSSFQYGYSGDNPLLGDEEDTQGSSEGGQFSSFQYGYSEDNPLRQESQLKAQIREYLEDLGSMDAGAFMIKYPDRDALQGWQDELQELMGEDEYTAFMKECASEAIEIDEGSHTAAEIDAQIGEAIVDTIIESTIEEGGGHVAEITGSGTLEYVMDGLPYAGIVYDCAGQYFASEDAKTALIENYVNFGANLWNMQHGEEYRDTLVWSPMATFDCDQEFLDRALLFQEYLSSYAGAGEPDATGMYWDELVVEDQQIDAYNAQHPEDQKTSKLDVIMWVASMSGPAYNDLVQETIVPLGKIAVGSWVSIYFGDWGMNY